MAAIAPRPVPMPGMPLSQHYGVNMAATDSLASGQLPHFAARRRQRRGRGGRVGLVPCHHARSLLQVIEEEGRRRST